VDDPVGCPARSSTCPTPAPGMASSCSTSRRPARTSPTRSTSCPAPDLAMMPPAAAGRRWKE